MMASFGYFGANQKPRERGHVALVSLVKLASQLLQWFLYLSFSSSRDCRCIQ